MRPGEQDGVSYYFWTVDQFQRARDEGRMLEWEIVHGRDYYGTPRDEVDSYREKGTGVVLVIDAKGAATIRKIYTNDHFSVFINAPFDELEARLRTRAAETEDRIQQRLKTAREEIARIGEFDCVILNRDLERTVEELSQMLKAKFNRTKL
jgi:guanylate kinase